MTSPTPADRWPATVLVPTRDERDNAEPLLTRLPLVDAVLFVDDSDDDTPEAIAAAAPLCDSPVEVLHRPVGQRSGGLAGAVVAGMPLVKSKWTVVMDGDLQHPPEVVSRLLERAENDDVDLIIASRRNWDSVNEGLSPPRKAASWVLGRLAFALFPIRLRPITDPLSGFFVFRTDAIDRDRLDPTGFKILLEIVLTHPELRVDEVGFAFAKRVAGESNVSVKEATRYLRHVARLRRRLSVQALRHAVKR